MSRLMQAAVVVSAIFSSCALPPEAAVRSPEVPTPAALAEPLSAEGAAVEEAMRTFTPSPAAGESPAHPAPSGSTLERAVSALGGPARLRQLTGLEYAADGERFFNGEGFFPGQDVVSASHYRSLTQYDLRAERSRQDMTRRLSSFGQPGQQLTYSLTLTQTAGQVTGGSENLFGFPSGPLVAAGIGAARRELALTNPQVFVQKALMNPSLATDRGPVKLRGRWYGRLDVRDALGDVSLYVDQRTGQLAALTTVESTQAERDVVTTVLFQWRASSLTPSVVALRIGGSFVLWERRDAARENPTFPQDAFDAGPGGPVDAAASLRGAVERENHQGLLSLGIPRNDVPQTLVVPVEVAPGVFAILGGSHNSMLVEQTQGLVLVEAPLDEDRSQAILAFAKSRFPSKRITHVVVTHHHVDHSGGVRTFVAEGAQVVAAQSGRSWLESMFQKRSTVVPDALELRPRQANVLSVGHSGLTLADAERPVVVLPAPNSHAQDMVVATLPNQKVLFQSDLWGPGFPPTTSEAITWNRQLYELIVESAPGTNMIVPGHASLATFAQLKQELHIP